MVKKDSTEFIKSVYLDNNLKLKLFLGKKFKKEFKTIEVPQSFNTLYDFNSFDLAKQKYDSIVNVHENGVVYFNYKLKIDYDKLKNSRLTKEKSRFAY